MLESFPIDALASCRILILGPMGTPSFSSLSSER